MSVYPERMEFFFFWNSPCVLRGALHTIHLGAVHGTRGNRMEEYTKLLGYTQ